MSAKVPDWKNSVYRADSMVKCPIDSAWRVLVDYERWNPNFEGAIIERIHGERTTEGELVLIQDKEPYVQGEPPPKFFAETVSVVPPNRIVWCAYPESGLEFRNFIDFSLEECAAGVRFTVRYYEQLQIPAELFESHRRNSMVVYEKLVQSFKSYCERQEPGPA